MSSKKKKISKIEKKEKNLLYSVVLPIAEVIFIIFILRWLVLEAYQVPTGSMIDTITPGDFLLVEKITYRFSPIEIGDVVVFEYPHDKRVKYVKRCLALGGDTIEIRDKVMYVNGEESPHLPTQLSDRVVYPRNPNIALDIVSQTQHWLSSSKHGPANFGYFRDNFGPYVIPDGHFYAIGDNRDDSSDSRFWGPVPMENITGRPTFIYLSTTLIDRIDPFARKDLTMVDNIILMLRSIVQFWHIRWDRMFMIIK